jgi:hypothetical protein
MFATGAIRSAEKKNRSAQKNSGRCRCCCTVEIRIKAGLFLLLPRARKEGQVQSN